jgi:hypothetical protein
MHAYLTAKSLSVKGAVVLEFNARSMHHFVEQFFKCEENTSREFWRAVKSILLASCNLASWVLVLGWLSDETVSKLETLGFKVCRNSKHATTEVFWWCIDN